MLAAVKPTALPFQPPSGGCVLKHFPVIRKQFGGKSSRLQAAVC